MAWWLENDGVGRRSLRHSKYSPDVETEMISYKVRNDRHFCQVINKKPRCFDDLK